MTFFVAVGLAAVLAGAIAAISGFGIGSLLTPLLMIALPAQHAVAAVAVPHALATTIRWLRLRRAIHAPTFRQFGIASAVGGLAGAALQPRLGSPVLASVLGCLLLLAGAGELFGRRLPLPQTPFWRLVGGMTSGFFGGLVGNQGGIRAAALAGFHLAPRELVATATASALLVDLARIPVYLISAPAAIAASAPLWLVASAGVTLGTLVGVPVLGRIPAAAYGRLLGGLLVVLGVSLLATVGGP